jgi:hypothetical protein
VDKKSVDPERQRYTQGHICCQAQVWSFSIRLSSVPGSMRHSSTLYYDYLQSTYKMVELSLEDKCKAAAKLIEQSPPGEVK